MAPVDEVCQKITRKRTNIEERLTNLVSRHASIEEKKRELSSTAGLGSDQKMVEPLVSESHVQSVEHSLPEIHQHYSNEEGWTMSGGAAFAAKNTIATTTIKSRRVDVQRDLLYDDETGLCLYQLLITDNGGILSQLFVKFLIPILFRKFITCIFTSRFICHERTH